MTDPILVAAESWIKPRAGSTRNRLNELCQRDQTRSIDDHRLDARRSLHVWSRPIRPLAGHREGAKIGVTQAQRLDPRDSSQLQDNKPLTAKRMERMGYLSGAQRLTGAKCSSM